MSRCRFCAAPATETLIDLGATPLANAFLEPTRRAQERAYPLSVVVCSVCRLAQVAESPPPDAHFTADYAYLSSFSESWVAHARAYVAAMIARFGLGPRSRVVEVASNDGYLLRHMVEAGVPSLGVEPAANCAAAAEAVGVRTRTAFFDEALAVALVGEGWAADLTIANNVLAHVPDIAGFARGFARLLKPDGVSTFEFPHLLELLERVQFDTIYHEHYSYLSLLAVERVFSASGLRVFDVETWPTHGGSVRVFACRADAAHAETPAVAAMRAREAAAGLDGPDAYRAFAPRVAAIRDGFRTFLAGAKAEGARVAAYGAAAKGNTFLNYCAVGPADIAFVVDRNPTKQGKLTPGSHLPVLGPEALDREKPDYLLILPWNLADEIAAQTARIGAWGGRHVVATPVLRVL